MKQLNAFDEKKVHVSVPMSLLWKYFIGGKEKKKRKTMEEKNNEVRR